MRRSLYHRTFLKKSNLYRSDLQRRPSTLPPHVQPLVTLTTLGVPLATQQERRARCPITRFSCPEEPCDRAVEIPIRRPYCSTTDESIPDFPLRIKKDLSADTFRQSQDSESSGSYLSPPSHRSVSYQAEDLEMEVFSKQSTETSECFPSMNKKSAGKIRSRSERILSFQDMRKKDSSDTNDETWRTCASAGDGVKSEPINDLYSTKTNDGDEKSRETLSWEDSVESGSSLSKSVIDVSQGEHLEPRFNRKVYELLESEKESDEFKGKKLPDVHLSRELFKWNTSYFDDYDTDNLATNREADIGFQINVFTTASDPDPGSPSELTEKFNIATGMFPGKRKLPTNPSMVVDQAARHQSEERDEGFDSPVYGSRDADELCDLFTSGQELTRREAFRKERSLDSDETSGFISKHSSETTDLSSRLSSTQFSTKHLSEPLGFGSAGTPTGMPRQQHSSEPQHLAAPAGSHTLLPSSDFGSKKVLSVDNESECQQTGTISKKREHFRKSKRLKHFNLRRIDDTDIDSSCDSEKPPPLTDDAIELQSARLKEEVGLPKHLSRDSSVDRYGLYKSRSEKTITSFESDRGAQARLHDFEYFCEAVNFSHYLPNTRQRAVSADEIEMSDLEEAPPSPRTPPRLLRRKSRSKRNLARRLKCLLL